MNLQTDRWFRRSDLGLVTTFVVTLGIFLVLLVPTGYGTRDIDDAQFVAFLAENQAVEFAWYMNILIGRAFLVVPAGRVSRLGG